MLEAFIRKKNQKYKRTVAILLLLSMFVLPLFVSGTSAYAAPTQTTPATSPQANNGGAGTADGTYDSWLNSWGTGDTYDGVTGTFVEDDPENAEKNKGVLGWVEDAIEGAISLLLRGLVSGFLVSLNDGADLSIESMVYGRVGNGNSSNYYQFGLEDGNVYGSVGSILYALLRNMMFVMFAIQFVWILANFVLKGTGKGRADVKTAIYNFVFLFALLYALPVVVDIVLFVRDSLLKLVVTITSQVTGHYRLGITDQILVLTASDLSLMATLLQICMLGGTLYFAVSYLKIAIQQAYLFGVFPVVAYRSFSDRQILNKWIGQFITALFVPVLDAIGLWFVVLIQSGASSNSGFDWASDTNAYGPTVLALIVFMSIIPCRNAICQLFGMPIPGRGFNLAAAAMMLMRAFGRPGHGGEAGKGNSGSGGGNKEASGGKDKPIENTNEGGGGSLGGNSGGTDTGGGGGHSGGPGGPSHGDLFNRTQYPDAIENADGTDTGYTPGGSLGTDGIGGDGHSGDYGGAAGGGDGALGGYGGTGYSAGGSLGGGDTEIPTPEGTPVVPEIGESPASASATATATADDDGMAILGEGSGADLGEVPGSGISDEGTEITTDAGESGHEEIPAEEKGAEGDTGTPIDTEDIPGDETGTGYEGDEHDGENPVVEDAEYRELDSGEDAAGVEIGTDAAAQAVEGGSDVQIQDANEVAEMPDVSVSTEPMQQADSSGQMLTQSPVADGKSAATTPFSDGDVTASDNMTASQGQGGERAAGSTSETSGLGDAKGSTGGKSGDLGSTEVGKQIGEKVYGDVVDKDGYTAAEKARQSRVERINDMKQKLAQFTAPAVSFGIDVGSSVGKGIGQAAHDHAPTFKRTTSDGKWDYKGDFAAAQRDLSRVLGAAGAVAGAGMTAISGDAGTVAMGAMAGAGIAKKYAQVTKVPEEISGHAADNYRKARNARYQPYTPPTPPAGAGPKWAPTGRQIPDKQAQSFTPGPNGPQVNQPGAQYKQLNMAPDRVTAVSNDKVPARPTGSAKQRNAENRSRAKAIKDNALQGRDEYGNPKKTAKGTPSNEEQRRRALGIREKALEGRDENGDSKNGKKGSGQSSGKRRRKNKKDEE